jgi:hypothetical protein
MSPQHFKGFCRSVNETLKAYEKVFGTLTIPDSETKPMTEAAEIEKMILETQRKQEEHRQSIRDASSSSNEKPRPSRRSRAARKE